MLLLNANVVQEKAMPSYLFFKKGNQVNALEGNEKGGGAFLPERGYSKESEELNAPDAHCALARFHDIRNEEQASEPPFSTGAALVALIVGLIAVLDWFFP